MTPGHSRLGMNDSPPIVTNDSPLEKNDSPPTYFVISQRGDLDFSGGLLSKSTWIPHNSRLPLIYVHCHWHAVVCFLLLKQCTLAQVLKPEEHAVKQQYDCVTDSSDYKPRSSFTSLYRIVQIWSSNPMLVG